MPPSLPPHIVKAADHTARDMYDRFAFLTEWCYTKDEMAQEDNHVKLIPTTE